MTSPTPAATKTVTVCLWNGKTITFDDAQSWEKPVGLLHVMRAGDPVIYSYPFTSMEHWETLPAEPVTAPVTPVAA
jgi:hypothetical protein